MTHTSEHTAIRSKAVRPSPVGAALRRTRGANMVEYIILVGVVALIALVGFKTFGGNVRAKIDKQAGEVRGIQ